MTNVNEIIKKRGDDRFKHQMGDLVWINWSAKGCGNEKRVDTIAYIIEQSYNSCQDYPYNFNYGIKKYNKGRKTWSKAWWYAEHEMESITPEQAQERFAAMELEDQY